MKILSVANGCILFALGGILSALCTWIKANESTLMFSSSSINTSFNMISNVVPKMETNAINMTEKPTAVTEGIPHLPPNDLPNDGQHSRSAQICPSQIAMASQNMESNPDPTYILAFNSIEFEYCSLKSPEDEIEHRKLSETCNSTSEILHLRSQEVQESSSQTFDLNGSAQADAHFFGKARNNPSIPVISWEFQGPLDYKMAHEKMLEFTREDARLSSKPLVVASYFPSWLVYQKPPKSALDFQTQISKLTHLIYSFVDIDPETGSVSFNNDKFAHYEWDSIDLKDLSSDSDIPEFRGNLIALWKIKKLNPSLKLGFSIGGSKYSQRYSSIIGDTKRRIEIVRSIKQLLVGEFPFFDFVDFDWETLNAPLDAVYMAEILLLLKLSLEGTGKYITMALPDDIGNLLHTGCGFPDPEILNRCVDLFFIMTYEYIDKLNPLSSHYAPFSAIEDSISTFLGTIDASKVVLGVLSYGGAFYNCSGLNQSFSSHRLENITSSRFTRNVQKIMNHSIHPTCVDSSNIVKIFNNSNTFTVPKFSSGTIGAHRDVKKKSNADILLHLFELLNLSVALKNDGDAVILPKYIPYFDIMRIIKTHPEWIVDAVFSNDAYLVLRPAKEYKETILVTYTSRTAVIELIRLCSKHKFAGIFFWELSGDIFKNELNESQSLLGIVYNK